MLNIEFLKIAQIELDDSFDYYEFQQENLGYRFLYEIKNAIERIKIYPNAWHKITENTRRCLLKNFPYGIIYQIKNDKILIVAVANLHRVPNYWKDRI
jgi:mRNA-degrading endonuclease RelE of RelBE toxin-antitoxin system